MGFLVAPGSLAAYLVGLALAAVSALSGFAVLRRVGSRRPQAFVSLLLGLFVARVALVVLFGFALLAVASSRLATGLLSLVGFHFLFSVVEVTLLARTRPTRFETGRRT